MSTLAFGSYTPGKSVIHSMNAQVKVILACAFSVGAFFVQTWLGMGLLWGLVILLYAAAHVPAGRAGGGLKPVAFILAMTVLCNMIAAGDALGSHDGMPGALGYEQVLMLGEVWGLSLDGFMVGLFFALRIALLVATCCLLSFTTSESSLMQALRGLLGPLGRIGVPVDDICLVASIALRFVPLLGEELQQARRAREARGCAFEGAGPAGAVKAWSSVLIPVIVALFKRADRLARALDGRCYGAALRGSLRSARWRASDAAALAAGLLIIIALGALL